MEKQFVPYELALKLKELGFNEECLAFFYKEEEDVLFENCSPYNSNRTFNYISAPLWQQAFAWCLDKLKLIESYAIIIDSDSYSLVIMDYCYNDIKDNLTESSTKIECLEKLIEIIEEYE